MNASLSQSIASIVCSDLDGGYCICRVATQGTVENFKIGYSMLHLGHGRPCKQQVPSQTRPCKAVIVLFHYFKYFFSNAVGSHAKPSSSNWLTQRAVQSVVFLQSRSTVCLCTHVDGADRARCLIFSCNKCFSTRTTI
jgi:hypothetical protein